MASSTTTQSTGATPSASAAKRKRSGAGLPSFTWCALKSRPSKRGNRPVRPRVVRIFSKRPEEATQVAMPAASITSSAATTPGIGCTPSVRSAASVASRTCVGKSSGAVHPSSAARMRKTEGRFRPTKRRCTTAASQAMPCLRRMSASTRQPIASLSTSTPSQSKMTSAGQLSCGLR